MTGVDTKQAGTPQIIDGKYPVVRELSREGNVTLYEVQSAQGQGTPRQVAWFDIATPADRQSFHAYRTALRAVAPAGLSDVVARPGAYYAVWQPLSGTPLAELLSSGVKKRQETIDAVEALAAKLADHGFALEDADIVVSAEQPSVAYLRPTAPRSAPDLAARNAPILGALRGGRVRRKRQPGAWLTFVPGLLLLAGAGWLGAQAAQIYLNPPVAEVARVIGSEAANAAGQLTRAGFRVEYTYGESAGAAVGAVIRQEPDGGTALPIGRLVVLTVNKPQPLVVPKLEDLTLAQAQAPLKDNALKLGKVVRVDGTASKTPEGRIIAQIPPPGSSSQRGQPIQVVVSTGIRGEETWIADLRGMTFEQAREHARAAGLVVTTWTKQPSDRLPNTVLAQEPAPFERVTVGSPVKLVLAAVKYSPPTAPAAPLPIPPPYVPPQPVQPAPDPAAPGQTTPGQPAPGQPSPEGTAPEQTLPTQNAPAPGTSSEVPAAPPTPEPAPAAEPSVPEVPEGAVVADPSQTRQVNLNYTFPSDLPAGTYTISVLDADGEREIMPGVDAAQVAGRLAQAPQAVRGDAVFIIRRDGNEYTRVSPQ
ncbi:PASTA domain, binds beta-lactams [Deinococcus reticulitermitis]|uniref:PASTA domain, binds beta-lactams n=1 Tax=Deinococcus reticulitermitis TaxID=856736 RepID=A0A1H7BKQ7_9DEIO|nr:PASTA domain-containing protein [Deinococcus reticulitermitis]SEJ77806.1 PASTA domain, binds beta-lactams [Deinococcus reticulitermitis]